MAFSRRQFIGGTLGSLAAWPTLAWAARQAADPGRLFRHGVASGDPLTRASGHFGLGHGGGAPAPDEYFVIDSTNPAVQGLAGATLSYVEYLYELAK